MLYYVNVCVLSLVKTVKIIQLGLHLSSWHNMGHPFLYV